jgi:hypothetical protein
MADAAIRIKLAEADGMMKNGDKYCKKALTPSQCSFLTRNDAHAVVLLLFHGIFANHFVMLRTCSIGTPNTIEVLLNTIRLPPSTKITRNGARPYTPMRNVLKRTTKRHCRPKSPMRWI